MNTKNFYWVREPENYQISDNEIRMTTEAHTDLWQKTDYHFVNDNAPLFLISIEEKYSYFSVKTDFSNNYTCFNQSTVNSWCHSF